MASNRSGGCLPLLAALAGLCLSPYAIASFATPVLAPYVYLHHPQAFADERPLWYTMLGAAPILSFFLVRWASSAGGRLRDRGAARHKGKGLRARRPHPVRGYLDRMLLVLGATSALTLWTVLNGADVSGTHAASTTIHLLVGNVVVLAVVLIGIRLWDRPYTPPVTVEQVRNHHRRAQKELKRVRADNDRVAAMVRKLEARLAQAGSRRDFDTLCTMHRESYGCANGVYDHYRSVEESLAVVSQLVRGVRISSWQPGNVAGRVVSRKARVAFRELRQETSGLNGTAHQLRAAWLDSQGRVKTLNARTADLKTQIRDDCGSAGLRWFADLEDRREKFRLAEGKPV